jgi:hypothetical protein
MAYKHAIDQQRAAALDELAAQAQVLHCLGERSLHGLAGASRPAKKVNPNAFCAAAFSLKKLGL